MDQPDPFAGTWKMNPQRSIFDPSHRPAEATMRFDPEGDGYVMYAEGISDGKHVHERPVRFVFDGKHHTVPGLHDVVAISTRPEPKTILMQGLLGDVVVGEARYVVSADGTTLTATVAGIDVEQRSFRSTVVWVRE
jgi:hypothetical protein